MTTMTRKTVLALLASLTLVTFSTASISTATASPPKALLLNPNPGHDCYDLPKFGFSSFSINGYGERITGVRWGGIAQRMGLENGDVILSLNGYPLTYHGSWNDALQQAVYNNGGYVKLRVRDVRTGFVAFRQTYVGNGYGPIEHNHYNGPVTYKSNKFNQPHEHMNGPEQIKQIVDLFNKKSNP
jgi:hypothetical protein